MGQPVTRSRFEALSHHKRALVLKADDERAEIATAYRRLHSSLDLKETIFGIGRTLKAHPMITAAGASTFVASGLAAKLLKGAGQVVAVSRVAIPLWSWWKRSHKP